ncbi:hypothetical protein Hanom_Chr03g00182761 [Helianthus anomalus]
MKLVKFVKAYGDCKRAFVGLLYTATDYIKIRVNFRFAPCVLVTLTVLLQTFRNNYFTL